MKREGLTHPGHTRRTVKVEVSGEWNCDLSCGSGESVLIVPHFVVHPHFLVSADSTITSFDQVDSSRRLSRQLHYR